MAESQVGNYNGLEVEHSATPIITSGELKTALGAANERYPDTAKHDGLNAALDAANRRYPVTPETPAETPPQTTPAAEVTQSTMDEDNDDLLFPGGKNILESNAEEDESIPLTTKPAETTPSDARISTEQAQEVDTTIAEKGAQIAAKIVELQWTGGTPEEIQALRDEADALLQQSFRQERAQQRAQRKQERAKAVADFKQGVADGVRSHIDGAKANVDLVSSGIKMGAEKYLIDPIANVGDRAKEVIKVGAETFIEAKALVAQARGERTIHRESRRLEVRNNAMVENLKEARRLEKEIAKLNKHITENIAELLQNGSLKDFMDQLGFLRESLQARLAPYGGSFEEHAKQNSLAGKERRLYNARYKKELSVSAPIDVLASLKAILKKKVKSLKHPAEAQPDQTSESTTHDAVENLETQQEEEQKTGFLNAARERLTKARETVGEFVKNNKGKTLVAVGIAMGLVMSLQRGGDKQNERPVGEGQPGIGAREQKAEEGVRAPEIAPAPNVTPAPATEPSPSERAENNVDTKNYLDRIHAIIAAKKAMHMSGSKEDNQILEHYDTIESEIVKNPSTHEWSPVGFYNDDDLNAFVQDYERMLGTSDKQQQHAQRQKLVQRLNQLNIDGSIIGGDPTIDLSQTGTKVMIIRPSEQTPTPLKPASEVRVALQTAQQQFQKA